MDSKFLLKLFRKRRGWGKVDFSLASRSEGRRPVGQERNSTGSINGEYQTNKEPVVNQYERIREQYGTNTGSLWAHCETAAEPLQRILKGKPSFFFQVFPVGSGDVYDRMVDLF